MNPNKGCVCARVCMCVHVPVCVCVVGVWVGGWVGRWVGGLRGVVTHDPTCFLCFYNGNLWDIPSGLPPLLSDPP